MSTGQLTFRVTLPAEGMDWVDLPIEIRRPNYTMVARVPRSEATEIEEGTYYISAKLPGGQELIEQVTIVAGQSEEVHLVADAAMVAESPSPFTWQGLPKGISLKTIEADGTRSLPPLGTLADEGALRVATGTPLKGVSFRTPEWTLTSDEAEGRIQWREYGYGPSTLAQLVQPGHPGLNVVLPIGQHRGCLINLTRLPAGYYTLEARLENVEADLLLRYRERGYLKQAAALADSSARTAEQLLQAKGADPVSAAVGAYALLRFGQLDRLHNWTENLMNWFQWLPDGLTIRAEHLAQQGEHQRALELLLELPQRGLPLFSDGLAHAVERLRLYRMQRKTQFSDDLMAQAETLLHQLEPFAMHTDFSRPILTFTGLDPAQPDARPLDTTTVQGVVAQGAWFIPDWLD